MTIAFRQQRRPGLLAGALLSLLAFVVALAAPASANSGSAAQPAGAERALATACSVPSGYTYVSVSYGLNSCSVNGQFAYVYDIRMPSDRLTACTVPTGFTYESVYYGLTSCSANAQFTYQYRLRVPASGIWVCQVPRGWAYSSVSYGLNSCSTNAQFAYQYRLA